MSTFADVQELARNYSGTFNASPAEQAGLMSSYGYWNEVFTSSPDESNVAMRFIRKRMGGVVATLRVPIELEKRPWDEDLTGGHYAMAAAMAQWLEQLTGRSQARRMEYYRSRAGKIGIAKRYLGDFWATSWKKKHEYAGQVGPKILIPFFDHGAVAIGPLGMGARKGNFYEVDYTEFARLEQELQEALVHKYTQNPYMLLAAGLQSGLQNVVGLLAGQTTGGDGASLNTDFMYKFLDKENDIRRFISRNRNIDTEQDWGSVKITVHVPRMKWNPKTGQFQPEVNSKGEKKFVSVKLDYADLADNAHIGSMNTPEAIEREFQRWYHAGVFGDLQGNRDAMIAARRSFMKTVENGRKELAFRANDLELTPRHRTGTWWYEKIPTIRRWSALSAIPATMLGTYAWQVGSASFLAKAVFTGGSIAGGLTLFGAGLAAAGAVIGVGLIARSVARRSMRRATRRREGSLRRFLLNDPGTGSSPPPGYGGGGNPDPFDPSPDEPDGRLSELPSLETLHKNDVINMHPNANNIPRPMRIVEHELEQQGVSASTVTSPASHIPNLTDFDQSLGSVPFITNIDEHPPLNNPQNSTKEPPTLQEMEKDISAQLAGLDAELQRFAEAARERVGAGNAVPPAPLVNGASTLGGSSKAREGTRETHTSHPSRISSVSGPPAQETGNSRSQ